MEYLKYQGVLTTLTIVLKLKTPITLLPSNQHTVTSANHS